MGAANSTVPIRATQSCCNYDFKEEQMRTLALAPGSFGDGRAEVEWIEFEAPAPAPPRAAATGATEGKSDTPATGSATQPKPGKSDAPATESATQPEPGTSDAPAIGSATGPKPLGD